MVVSCMWISITITTILLVSYHIELCFVAKQKQYHYRYFLWTKDPFSCKNINYFHLILPAHKIFFWCHWNKIINVCFLIFLQVLEELLTKLDIEHVTWNSDKKGYYYTVVFPIPAGDPCETTLHCLTKLGIGIKAGSSVRYLWTSKILVVLFCSPTSQHSKLNMHVWRKQVKGDHRDKKNSYELNVERE